MALDDILTPLRDRLGAEATDTRVAEALIGSAELMNEVDRELKAVGLDASSDFIEDDWWASEIRHGDDHFMLVPAGLGDWPVGWFLVHGETIEGTIEYPEFDTVTLNPRWSLAPLLTEPAEVARLVLARLND